MVRWPRWGKRAKQQAGPTVHFSEAARARLRELVRDAEAPRGVALRIFADLPPFGPPHYGMALEPGPEPRPDDAVIEVDGIRVLVDSQSLPAVDGATVDFVDDPLRPGFTIEPPQRLAAPPGEAAPPRPRPELDLSNPLVATVQQVLEEQINPGIAMHGGHCTLIDVRDNVVYVELSGGCQGCAMAAVTLKQGVEYLIRQAVPQIREVVDVTDHAGGSNPYYSGAKSGPSPFHQAAKS